VLLSHDCARKTASRPNNTANPIITMVLARTAKVLFADERSVPFRHGR
jgi:hypothetical protein